MSEHNWAGNHTYRAARIHRPTQLDQVRRIVADAPRLRVLGSRHSFNDIADADELLSLEELPADVDVDHERRTVTFSGALRYGDLAEVLHRHDLALANLASLPHISVAGAVATATHGSGVRNGNLATSVAGLQLVTSTGDVVTATRGDADFDGMVVNLGALGAVTRMTLDTEPAYQLRQRVYEGLGWDALYDHLDVIAGEGYSVSVFTRWGDAAGQVWVKSRVTDEPERVRDELYGAVAATVDRHPILGLDPVNCSPQLGVPGPWSDRLPHFRMGFTPSSGDELQSELLVPRTHAVDAIRAVHRLADVVTPVLLVSELRMVAADRLWMSPQHSADTLAIHFTWRPDRFGVDRALAAVETALRPMDARPHWGKLFHATADDLAPLYDRRSDFIALADRLDPRGAFRNRWFEQRVVGPG